MYVYASPEQTHLRRLSDGALIPADPVNADYREALERQAQGEVIALFVGPTLEVVKAGLANRLDADAEAVRGKFLTPGVGMAMTYQKKAEQAKTLLALGPDAVAAMSEAEYNDLYPTLAASVGIEAPTLWDCALLVVTREAEMGKLSFVIERTRQAGKRAIHSASTKEEAQAVYEAITWTV